MTTAPSAKALHSSLRKLDISKPSNSKSKKAEPADSWEDEAGATSGSDTETEATPPFPADDDSPAPPPPTPSSPSMRSFHDPYRTFPPYGLDGEGTSSPTRPFAGAAADGKRPEKSTAVASRLIAAGIGQKAPKRTKEQREFDAAAKAQERKKRELAKAEEERKRVEKEKALKDVWGD